MTKRVFLVFLASAAIHQVAAWAQDADPMDRFRPFVGKWHVQQVLQLSATQPLERSELIADIHFLADNKVLVVAESSPDGSFRFLGFHAYDETSGKYLNWGASSSLDIGWAEGEFDEVGKSVTYVDRKLELAGKGSIPLGRGTWQMLGPDRHEYKWFGVGPDGKQFLGKHDVYTRIP